MGGPGIGSPQTIFGPGGTGSSLHNEDYDWTSAFLCLLGLKLWAVWPSSAYAELHRITGYDKKSKLFTIDLGQLEELIKRGLPKPTIIIQGPKQLGNFWKCIFSVQDDFLS